MIGEKEKGKKRVTERGSEGGGVGGKGVGVGVDEVVIPHTQ